MFSVLHTCINIQTDHMQAYAMKMNYIECNIRKAHKYPVVPDFQLETSRIIYNWGWNGLVPPYIIALEATQKILPRLRLYTDDVEAPMTRLNLDKKKSTYFSMQ